MDIDKVRALTDAELGTELATARATCTTFGSSWPPAS